jgi:hypothetical protein
LITANLNILTKEPYTDGVLNNWYIATNQQILISQDKNLYEAFTLKPNKSLTRIKLIQARYPELDFSDINNEFQSKIDDKERDFWFKQFFFTNVFLIVGLLMVYGSIRFIRWLILWIVAGFKESD